MACGILKESRSAACCSLSECLEGLLGKECLESRLCKDCREACGRSSMKECRVPGVGKTRVDWQFVVAETNELKDECRKMIAELTNVFDSLCSIKRMS